MQCFDRLRNNYSERKYNKEPSGAQSDVKLVLFVKSPIKLFTLSPCAEKSVKFVVFRKKGGLNQNRTDLSLLCDLNDGESVFGLDLRNSTRGITQLFWNVK